MVPVRARAVCCAMAVTGLAVCPHPAPSLYMSTVCWGAASSPILTVPIVTARDVADVWRRISCVSDAPDGGCSTEGVVGRLPLPLKRAFSAALSSESREARLARRARAWRSAVMSSSCAWL